MDSKPDLNDLAILCAVVDLGSFRAAADRIGTSQPTVSRAIARLEERLDRPLVRRNSRRVSPTELGLRYAEHARRLLREFSEGEAELLSDGVLCGTVSVSVPPALGRRVLTPALAAFCALYPSVRLDVSFENRRVDLVDDNVDVAIRFGPLAATWQRQRRLLRGRHYLYGGAQFADHAELPVGEMLRRAPCLVLHSTHLRDRWPFLIDGRQEWFTVEPALRSNDVSSLIEFAVLGAGVTVLPDFLVAPEVACGDLVPLTKPAEGLPAEVFAVTNDEKRSQRVLALLDHLSTRMADP